MKMKVLLATYGTMGDVQPFVGLAQELKRRGHVPTLCAPPRFRAHVEGYGIPFVGLGPQIEEREWREIFAPAMGIPDTAEQVRRTLSVVTDTAPRMLEELLAACTDADVLVAFPYQIAGLMAHERTSIPYVSYHLSPFGVFRGKRFSAVTREGVNAVRKRLGFPELEAPLGADSYSNALALITISPALFRRPRSWPEHHHLTGFHFTDPSGWEPDPELVAFLEAGESPVVIGFGSMYHADPAEVAATVRDAIRISGRRAVVQRGWSGLEVEGDDQFLGIGFVPHDWLFPRCACIVHAGGSGTSGATFRAGVPSVVVPHWLDQSLFGHLAVQAHTASDSIPFAELEPQRLGRAIRRASEERHLRERAAALGERVRSENGTATSVSLIEAMMSEEGSRHGE